MKEYGKYVLNLTAKSAVDFKIDFILENDPMNSLFRKFPYVFECVELLKYCQGEEDEYRYVMMIISMMRIRIC